MNKVKFLNIALLTFVILGFSSCEKYFGDTNVNPDKPTTVIPSVLLSTVQGQLAYALGGDASRHASIYTRHVHGEYRQWAVIQNYGISRGDINTLWGDNLYAGILSDLKALKNLADENEYNHYGGIARVLEAYTLMLISDLWGDVPFSEALDAENFKPKFDTQESIYTAIFAMLSEAQTLLAKDVSFGVENDLMYAGDADAWSKFGRMIAARGYLHLGKVSADNYQQALNELAQGFTSSADDALFKFGTAPPQQAPWYQFNDQRGDIIPEQLHAALLNSLNDTFRVKIFDDPYLIDKAEFDAAHPYFVKDRALPLLNYTEMKFMEAECLLKTGGADADVRTAYLAGIEASFSELSPIFTSMGFGDAADRYAEYIAQPEVNDTANPVTLEHVMTQKYIALFTSTEVFNDWRRTGIPELVPNTGNVIPRRFPFPEEEYLYNEANVPANGDIFDRVWWDK